MVEKEGALLLDVRSPAEFADHSIEGSVNIPIGELESRLSELPDTSRPIVVYCRSGSRSSAAAEILSKHGYAKVYNMRRVTAW